MKLRQKLAVVLASAMVLTAVPVVTMAASTTTVSKVVTTADTDKALENAPTVNIALKHTLESDEFYITLEGAEWQKVDGKWAVTEGTNVTVTPTSKTEATVTVTDLVAANKAEALSFKLSNAIVKADEAYVVIDGEGTEITSDKILFAKKSTAKATVTSKNDKTFYTTKGSELSEIVVEESVVGTFNGEHTIEIDLDNSDFEFVTDSTVTVAGTKGISTPDAKDVTIKVEDDRVTITLPAAANSQRGGYKIAGIEVKSVDKAPTTGDLNVTVSGKKGSTTTIESKTVAVAKVAEYGTELTVEKKKEVVAGKEATVKVTLEETTADSISNGAVEFTLSQGVMMSKPSIDGVDADDIEMVAKDKKDLDKGYTGFIVDFGGNNTKVEELVATIKIETEVGTTGEISVAVEGRHVEEQSVVVAEVAPNFTVSTEAMTLKVGQTKQVGGKVVVKETEAGTFKSGTKFTIEVAKDNGITLTELPEVSATNGMTVKASWGTSTTTASTIVVEVTRASKEAAEITIEDFEVKTDRTVAQGAYDAELTVSNLKGEVELKDFLTVGTLNTEDLGANGLVTGTSSFVIGENKYTLNGVEKTMDAASYIQDPGYTMIPVRYVAEAFGVKGNDILFSNGVVTIFAGNRTVQLTSGSNVAVVNGVQIQMATKVVVKEGRTYAPVGEIAKILGVSSSWDNTAKTATFTNK